jgi:hypothetical protein
MEQEAGESKPGPHYIVAAYPRPGAILTHIVIQYVKDIQKQAGTKKIDSKKLKSFVTALMK